MGQKKSILGHKKMKYGTEQGDFLGQEKLTYGHNKTNFGTEQGDFLGQAKLILGLFNSLTAKSILAGEKLVATYPIST